MTLQVNGLYLNEIQSSYTIGGCIDIFENVWPNPEETIGELENQVEDLSSGIYWQKALTIGLGAQQDIRTNKMLGLNYFANIENNPICQKIINQYYTLLLSTTNVYAKKYNIHETFWHEQYSVLKYVPGTQYHEHYDGGTNIGRAISCVCYLNDDYEGGEIEFINFKVKIKPQKGMLILFPSNYAYRHIAHPVISGTKYNLVTWILDRQM